MQIPMPLQEAVLRALEGYSPAVLAAAGQALSRRYRQEDPGDMRLAGAEEAAAYAVFRMPATYGAVRGALAYALEALPELSTAATLLDAGAGPGTVMWALAEVLPALERCILLEREPRMAALGQKLAQAAPRAAVQAAHWQAADLSAPWEAPVCDIVTAAYVLGELEDEAMLTLALRLWEHTGHALLLVEPGTPRAHGRMLRLRQALLEAGAYLAAPCPHSGACPLPEGDWCHAVQRIDRTGLHRLLKDGALGYEDEKFTYLVFSRTPPCPAAARVLRRPVQRKGVVQARLCTAQGIREVTVSRRDRERYREARDWTQGSRA